MAVTIKTKYLGGLRTHSLHLQSGNELITDAPVDNNGKGEAFSPTDLLAASLASCMLTIMGITANKNGFNIDGIDCNVTKVMSSSPRKVAEVIIEMNFPENNFGEKEKNLLKEAAFSCPVALSIHENIKKNVIFNF